MSEERCRLDVWLWRARFFKSRSLAAAHLAAGGVRLDRPGGARRAEPATQVAPGDRLVFAGADGRVRCISIVALGHRRGPASEARSLYEEIQALLDDGAEVAS